MPGFPAVAKLLLACYLGDALIDAIMIRSDLKVSDLSLITRYTDLPPHHHHHQHVRHRIGP